MRTQSKKRGFTYSVVRLGKAARKASESGEDMHGVCVCVCVCCVCVFVLCVCVWVCVRREGGRRKLQRKKERDSVCV